MTGIPPFRKLFLEMLVSNKYWIPWKQSSNLLPTWLVKDWVHISPRSVSGFFSIDFNVREIKFLTGNSKVPPNHVLYITRLVCSYARQNTLWLFCLCQAHLSLTVGLFSFFSFFFLEYKSILSSCSSRVGNYQHIYEMFFGCSENVFIIATGPACSALIAVVQNLSEINTVECPWGNGHEYLSPITCWPSKAFPQGTPGVLLQLENGCCGEAAPFVTDPVKERCPTADLLLPGLPLQMENV